MAASRTTEAWTTAVSVFRMVQMVGLSGVSLLIAIVSSSDCPSVDAVRSRLAVLLPSQADSEDAVEIEPRSEGLEVVMHSALHHTVLRRLLPLHYTCEEKAALVATLIAAWRMEEGQRPAEPAPPSVQPESAPPAFGLRRALRYELGGALTAGIAGDAVAAGGLLDVLLLPGARRFGLRLGLLGQSPRTFALASGEVSWLRAGLSLSGTYRYLPSASSRWSVDASADAVLAMVVVSASGFTVSRAGFDADVALGGSVRIGHELGSVRPFLLVTLLGWMRPQRISALAGNLVTLTLPQIEVLFGLGLAVGRTRSTR